MAIKPSDRKKAEALIFAVLDSIDTTKTNSEYYKKVFCDLSDKQFEEMFKQKIPMRLHTKPYEVEPAMKDLFKAAKLLNLQLIQPIALPHLYKDKDGNAVMSKPCLVGYLHLRREQQVITKKNGMSTDISARDMKTGLLIRQDKNGSTSDVEIESMLTMGLDSSVDEFTGPRADRMISKSEMYNTISIKGNVSKEDISNDIEDSLAANLFNTYTIGAHLYTNSLNKDYMTPRTLEK